MEVFLVPGLTIVEIAGGVLIFPVLILLVVRISFCMLVGTKRGDILSMRRRVLVKFLGIAIPGIFEVIFLGVWAIFIVLRSSLFLDGMVSGFSLPWLFFWFPISSWTWSGSLTRFMIASAFVFIIRFAMFSIVVSAIASSMGPSVIMLFSSVSWTPVGAWRGWRGRGWRGLRGWWRVPFGLPSLRMPVCFNVWFVFIIAIMVVRSGVMLGDFMMFPVVSIFATAAAWTSIVSRCMPIRHVCLFEIL